MNPNTGMMPQDRSGWERKCPLSLITHRAVSQVNTALMVDAKTITIGYDEACSLPRIFWDVLEYVRSERQAIQSERTE